MVKRVSINIILHLQFISYQLNSSFFLGNADSYLQNSNESQLHLIAHMAWQKLIIIKSTITEKDMKRQLLSQNVYSSWPEQVHTWRIPVPKLWKTRPVFTDSHITLSFFFSCTFFSFFCTLLFIPKNLKLSPF